MKPLNLDKIAYLFIGAFFLSSLFLISDFGLVYDSPKNFYEGDTSLSFISGEPLSGHDRIKLAFQIHGAYFLMLASLSKRSEEHTSELQSRL